MSPLVKDQVDRLVKYFDGKVYVLQDNGDTAIVLIDPKDRSPCARQPDDPGNEWKRVSEPCLVLVDPSRTDYPRLVN